MRRRNLQIAPLCQLPVPKVLSPWSRRKAGLGILRESDAPALKLNELSADRGLSRSCRDMSVFDDPDICRDTLAQTIFWSTATTIVVKCAPLIARFPQPCMMRSQWKR